MITSETELINWLSRDNVHVTLRLVVPKRFAISGKAAHVIAPFNISRTRDRRLPSIITICPTKSITPQDSA